MLGHRLEYAQLDVGQRTDGQRHALRRQTLDQRLALDAAHAVVNALHLEHVERAFDVRRRTLLASMRHQFQPQLAGAGKDAAKLLRRMAALATVESDADEQLAVRQRRLERGQRIVFA